MSFVLNATLFSQKRWMILLFQNSIFINLVDSDLVFQLYIYMYIYIEYITLSILWRFELDISEKIFLKNIKNQTLKIS